jgi:hypothetical protein
MNPSYALLLAFLIGVIDGLRSTPVSGEKSRPDGIRPVFHPTLGHGGLA